MARDAAAGGHHAGGDQPARELISAKPARIRLAGTFLKQFAVWRVDTPSCEGRARNRA